jgi:hypothetical protein
MQYTGTKHIIYSPAIAHPKHVSGAVHNIAIHDIGGGTQHIVMTALNNIIAEEHIDIDNIIF